MQLTAYSLQLTAQPKATLLTAYRKHLKMQETPLKVDYKTDTGKRRAHNEDSIIVDYRKGIFLLADGMGGHQAGEVASRMAVEVAYDHLLATLGSKNTDADIFKVLASSLFKADRSIKISSTEDNFTFMGMGTTLVIALVRGDSAYLCHAGDSRAYLLRQHVMKQLTKDQTWGEYLVEEKHVAREKIPPQSWHVLTQAVGVTHKIRPELKKVKLKAGDILLLCSDGLTDMLTDEEIKKIVWRYKNSGFDETAMYLVKAANHKGGRDNISVVLVKYKLAEVEFECTTCRSSPRDTRKIRGLSKKGKAKK